jgi:hypothetical protein
MLSTGEGLGRLERLRSLYSHFRPFLPVELHRVSIRRAGLWRFDSSNYLSDIQTEYVCQNVHLESHEFFSQLCTIIDIVEDGAKPGLVLSHANIGRGVIRVWRDWLAGRCAWQAKSNILSYGENLNELEVAEREECLLWADPRENVGLRVRALERKGFSLPTPTSTNEETPVFYMLEYEGKAAPLIGPTLLMFFNRTCDKVNSTPPGTRTAKWAGR